MASEKTPNLGLNQIDRTSPKTTYFDLEKYLDQNWRAVDNFAGDVNDGVNEIKKRLDTTERKAVTLEPGVQILNAVKAAPFSLSGITGRMLVNLLGRAGSGDQIGSLLGWEADLAVDTSNKAQGAGSIKVTAKNATGVYNVYSSGLKLTGGRYYIALADVKNINASNNIYVNFSAGGNKALKQSVDQSQFVTIYTKCAPTSDTATNLEVASISTATGQAFYADAIRLYEVSASEYAALDSMTAEQVVVKYPYVDSVMPVHNPYAIRYGENLIPSFYEWTLSPRGKVTSPYKLETIAAVSTDLSSVDVPVSPNITYTFAVKVNGRVTVVEVDSSGVESNLYRTDDNENRTLSTTFTTKATTMKVRVYSTNTGAGTFTLENPILNIGSTAKPFKPREDSMLALQTDLYADPVTGLNADTVFERDGQYFKAKKWQDKALDGSFAWELPGSYAGYKVVGTSGFPVAAAWNALYVTKYDGKILSKNSAMTSADNAYFRNQATKDYLDVSIPSTDSGWGDNYTPTADEIKAYFNGWKMKISGQAASSTYDGTGTKAWVEQAYARNTPSYVGEVKDLNRISSEGPLAYTLNGLTPYQLVYQLATSTVEPIVSEGQLTFNEGDNQVEAGTGIVLRESADVYTETGTPYGNRGNINNANFSARLLKNRTTQMLAVYKNGVLDTRWNKSSGWTTSAGALAQLLYASYEDRESAYSVTYLMLDRLPVAPFVGSYAANEKTLLLDLVDSVQQANLRLSVVENKKADKDSPSWITPTLLNGVIAESSSLDMQPQYLKMSDNLIKMHGSIKVPTSNATVTFFRMPEGYRPKILTVLTCAASDAVSGDKTAVIAISPDGRVEVVGRGGYGWVRLDAVQFIAEG